MGVLSKWKNRRALLALILASAVGIFVAVASHALNWSDTSTLVVGISLTAVLASLGTPLIMLPWDQLREVDLSKEAIPPVSGPRVATQPRPWLTVRSVKSHELPTELDENGPADDARASLLEALQASLGDIAIGFPEHVHSRR